MKCYKLCYTKDGRHYSYLRNSFDKKHSSRIEYKIGEWVYPEFGKLFVFDTFDNVLRFGDSFIPLYSTLFECEVQNPSRGLMYTPFGTKNEYKKFWQNQRNGIPCHEGTLLVDAVKLTKPCLY